MDSVDRNPNLILGNGGETVKAELHEILPSFKQIPILCFEGQQSGFQAISKCQSKENKKMVFS